MNQSRRTFLKATSALAVTGAAPFAMNLAALGSAAAQTSGNSDYKAIVCIFFQGGNDQSNTLIPFDTTNYNVYYNARKSIALSQSQMTQINPANITDGRQFALHSSLAPLAALFQSGQVATLANVGPLIVPTTKAQYTGNQVPIPPKLFSHNDQQSTWQSFAPEGAQAGWGGRIGDLLQSNNNNPIFTCVSASGTSTLLAGQQVLQYPVGLNGSTPITALQSPLLGSASATALLKSMITDGARSNVFEKDHGAIVQRSIDANGILTGALASAPSLDLTPDVTNFSLAKQLRIVARMIAAQSALGIKRQVFFVSVGSFDTHDNQLVNQGNLFDQVAKSMNYFYNMTVSLGMQNNVTAFTASDFGRTLTSNGDGSDHGWGSHHFIMGGAVKGQNMYGTFPTLGINIDSDVGSGRLIPTTSVDQYAATLGAWMGLSNSQLLDIMPNLKNFSNQNLGFI